MPPSEMKYDLFCFLIGEKRTFLVEFDPAKLVGHLKNDIKKTRGRALDGIDSCDLRLYLVEIDHSLGVEERINKLIQSSQKLDECTWLNDDQQGLSVHFGGGAEGKYIIVQIPGGEPFNLRCPYGPADVSLCHAHRDTQQLQRLDIVYHSLIVQHQHLPYAPWSSNDSRVAITPSNHGPPTTPSNDSSLTLTRPTSSLWPR